MDTIERIIEEEVPELKEPEKPKKLGFFGAMKKAADWWWKFDRSNRTGTMPPNVSKLLKGWAVSIAIGTTVSIAICLSNRTAGYDYYSSIAFGAVLGFFYPVAAFLFGSDFAKKDGPGDKRFMNGSFSFMIPTIFCACSVSGQTFESSLFASSIPLFVWAAQAPYWMIRSRREQATITGPVLPSMEEIGNRFLKRIQSEVVKTKNDVVGPSSPFENRLAELKQKRTGAERLRKYFLKRWKDCGKEEQERFRELTLKAVETVDMFDAEIKSLGAEQAATLELFTEIEAFVPTEQAKLQDDAMIAELQTLRGEAVRAREVSREMIMEIVKPTMERITALNAARERLLSHSLAALQPISLERFIAKTEAGAESVVRLDGAIRRIGEVGTDQDLMS